jgi:hypothetical protein
VREAFKKAIISLLILSIPLAATTASADFVNESAAIMRHFAEVIHMILLGIGLFAIAALFRKQAKH